MARKKVQDLSTDKVLGFGDEKDQVKRGREIEGYLLGHKKVNTDYGPASIHVLQNDTGTFGVWGSAKLTSLLQQIELGTKVFIKYVDKVKIPGGKTMKKFDVEFDDEDKIDVANTEINLKDPNEEEQGEEDGNYEASGEEEGETEEQEAEQEEEQEQEPVAKVAAKTQAKPSASPASAKAQALLNKNRRSASA